MSLESSLPTPLRRSPGSPRMSSQIIKAGCKLERVTVPRHTFFLRGPLSFRCRGFYFYRITAHQSANGNSRLTHRARHCSCAIIFDGSAQAVSAGSPRMMPYAPIYLAG